MLYQTYENNVHMAGKSVDDKAPLSLVAHMPANAQIEITIDADGNFNGACELDKKQSKTLIPVTEQSQSRANKNAPHALSDNLTYVAGDFGEYISDEKLAGKSKDRFALYKDALGKWAESEYSHPKVKAVYAYISKKSVASDLIKSGVFECGENGKLADKKISGNPYEKVLVRFVVIGCDDGTPNATWQDFTLFDKYTKYYSTVQKGVKDVCYLTGEKQTVCLTHPKGIIASNYGAKLISANDDTNYTYRGRFTNSEEAYSVSYEATQKAHNALTWLVARQGYTFGNKDKRTFVCWNPKGKEVPEFDDPLGMDVEDDTGETSYTEELYKKKLIKAIAGIEQNLDDNDDIVVIGLDAATTGRLSVTYYNELKFSDFIERIYNWYDNCCWYFTRFTNDGKPYKKILAPQTRRIAEYAFGTEQSNYIEVNDKLMKEQAQRIISCILDAKRIPKDIIHAITMRASTPLAYSRGNRERILSTACALIKKYYKEKGAEIKMTLDYAETDRSYLFGRLLAVAEKVERDTYLREETREPNAIRLQSAFVHHPMHTWKLLEVKLNPYYKKHSPGTRMYYKKIVTDLVTKINESDKDLLNTALSEKYLVGYYLQRAELYKEKANKNNNNENAKED